MDSTEYTVRNLIMNGFVCFLVTFTAYRKYLHLYFCSFLTNVGLDSTKKLPLLLMFFFNVLKYFLFLLWVREGHFLSEINALNLFVAKNYGVVYVF